MRPARNADGKTDEYGRRWGEPLWAGGPILGGKDWQEFVKAKRERDAEKAPLPRVRGQWEDDGPA